MASAEVRKTTVLCLSHCGTEGVLRSLEMSGNFTVSGEWSPCKLSGHFVGSDLETSAQLCMHKMD